MELTQALTQVRQYKNKGRYTEAARHCLAILKRDPANIEANLLYGQLAIDMRRPEDAIVIFSKLLAMAPDNAVAHDSLAYLYNETNDYANAKRHALAAIRLNPMLLESQLVLGAIEILEGDKARGLRMFDNARQRAPGQLRVEMAYAQALLQCGEFDRARALLRELIARHPDNTSLYSVLAHAGKIEDGSPEARLIRSLVGDAGRLARDYDDKNARVTASMALYKLYSDLDRPRKAFTWLQRAKAVRREQYPYDEKTITTSRQGNMAIFTPDFFSTRNGVGCDTTAPIFIVGMPRSGTTLLERVLYSSPDVSLGGELPFVGRLRDEACAKFGTNQYDSMALTRVPNSVWAQLGEEYVFRARQRVADTPHFTDKMPGNYMFIGFIRTMLPRARIIHLSRHPVANCLSLFEADFALGHNYVNDLEWLGHHYAEYRRMMDYWRECCGDALIELRYETLVADTAGTLLWLGEQLGLELDEAHIRGSQQTGGIATASLWQARQPIHTDSVARWQRLSEELAPLITKLEAEGIDIGET